MHENSKGNPDSDEWNLVLTSVEPNQQLLKMNFFSKIIQEIRDRREVGKKVDAFIETKEIEWEYEDDHRPDPKEERIRKIVREKMDKMFEEIKRMETFARRVRKRKR